MKLPRFIEINSWLRNGVLKLTIKRDNGGNSGENIEKKKNISLSEGVPSYITVSGKSCVGSFKTHRHH